MAISTLVAVDGPDAGRHTSRYAIRLARALPLEITLLHAVQLGCLESRMIPDFQVEMIAEGARKHAQGLLDRAVAYFREAGLKVEDALREGDAARVICTSAEDARSDLVMVGRRGHGELHDLIFGSVCSQVMYGCSRPVFIVQQDVEVETTDDDAPVSALVALDEGPSSERCLEYLLGLAPSAKDGLELNLIYVVNRDQPGLRELPNNARYEAVSRIRNSGEAVLHGAARRLRGAGYRVAVQVEEGSVGVTLCEVALTDGHEVVVIGRRAASELGEHGFGSVSRYVSHRCACHTWLTP